VVTTVDAATGDTTLGTYEEAVKQVALADRLLVTKTDITSSEAGERLRTKLRSLNRGAPIISVVEGVVSPTELFNAGYYNPETKRADVRRWLAVEAYHHDEHGHDHHDEDQDHRYHDHLSNIYSFCLTFGTPLPWQPFVTAVRGLINSHGAKLLRIKGIINIANRSQPIVIHGVQQLLHPPVMLDAWPDDDHQSRIVFITRDIRRQTVEQALTAFI